MAIELAPKKKTSAKGPIDLFTVAFYLLIGLAVGLTFSWLFLHYSETKAQKRLDEIETTLIEWRSGEIKKLEGKVLSTKEKVEVYEKILASHKKNSLFFDFISKVCHKNVYFRTLELDSNLGKASLRGRTEDFSDLREQILILESIEPIKQAAINEVSFNEEGGLDFSLDLTLDRNVFQEEFELEEEIEEKTESSSEEGSVSSFWDVYRNYVSVLRESISSRDSEKLSSLERTSYKIGSREYENYMQECPEEFGMSEAGCEESFWNTMESLLESATLQEGLSQGDFESREEDENQIIISTGLRASQEGYSKNFLYFLKDGDQVLFLSAYERTLEALDGEAESALEDSDGDGLPDRGESQITLSRDVCEGGNFQKWDMECVTTDPNLKDTDGDGFWDGVEVQAETDPNDGGSYPTLE